MTCLAEMDRLQTRTTSLEGVMDKNAPIRFIDAFVGTFDQKTSTQKIVA